MIIAYHAVFTTYGTWLPNDPRGSYSKEIYNDQLRLFGEIKYGRQAPPPRKLLLKFYSEAACGLGRPAFFINDNTRPIIAAGFGRVVQRLNIEVPATAIMNDHIHVLVLRSKYRIEYIVNQLKGSATHALKLKRSPWTRGCWKVFINDTGAISAATKYINANPAKAGLASQFWNFVKPLV
ncbi:MAG: transposase [Planctomycetes bacterium]|nr:transposase [Planctomycetota bacterium]